jgi:hypothetical protein
MSQYTFQTRFYGPNAKGTTLTWEDLDDSLLFLSESINALNSNPLSGSNYIFLEANGTPTQNGLSLSASYELAKTVPPSPTNKFSILAGPGQYFLDQDFLLDTEYLDVISLTGEKDAYITGSGTIFVNANNITVRGIDVDTKNFTIINSFPNTIIKNCKGGDESFGGSPIPVTGSQFPGYTIASKFIDCEGGDRSFAGFGSAYGTFINCIGGNNSFGDWCNGTFTNCVGGDYSFGYTYDIEGGTIENCTAGAFSFAPNGNINTLASLKNCTGGQNSFAQGISTITGLISGCRLTLGSFNTSNVDGPNGGRLANCINGDNTITTYP